jgi:hypothetical protein
MFKFVKKFFEAVGVASVVFVVSIGLFYALDATPEMAWSQSKDTCVRVLKHGKRVPNGCQLVADGKLSAERYTVR